MDKHEFELLAPAGDLNIFYSVIDAGADAVYFGGAAFGARAYATNFSYEDAKNALLYAHLQGKKAYLTVNTILKNTEIERELFDYIRSYCQIGIDAFLVQDFGVFTLIRDCFPDAHIHMSTQCALMNKYGVSFFKDRGAKRIVLPRELSLAEMKSIHESTGASLEAFVHGAICICYSGDCLMSSMIGGRSGNRGRCAQPCRQPYDVYSDGKKIRTKGKYMLSPKEMCGINDLEGLYDAGIESLKIEGRMRSREYAAGVVSMYRKYMDILLESGKGQKLSEADQEKILALGNRCGHTNAYYHHHNDSSMFSFESASMSSDITPLPNDIGIETFPVGMTFDASKDQDISLSIDYKGMSVKVTAPPAQEATGSGTSDSDIKKQLKKTGQTYFYPETITVNADLGLFIPLGVINKMRRMALGLLSDMILKLSDHINANSPEDIILRGKGIPGMYLCICDDTDKADLAIKNDIINAVGITYSAATINPSVMDKIHDSGKSAVLILPPVIRQEYVSSFEVNMEKLLPVSDKIIASSFDGLAFLIHKGYNLSDIILSPRMYTYSDRALYAFEKLGITACISPFELNKKELLHRYSNSTLFYIYGRVPLMYMAACVHKNTKGCDKCPDHIELKDRKGKLFPVRNDCSICMNTIYNSLPMSLMGEKRFFEENGFSGFVIDLSCDDYDTARAVLDSVSSESGPDLPFETTKGHFNRGVE